MNRPNLHRISRGSTLVLVMVLLAVLSLVGVAAVTISNQERTNVSAKAKRDIQLSCAKAAQLLVIAEIARASSNYLTSNTVAPSVTLPDGTTLAQTHYDSLPGVTVLSITPDRVLPINSDPAAYGAADLTNTFDAMGKLPTTVLSYPVIARCQDSKGRQLEVEFVIAPAL